MLMRRTKSEFLFTCCIHLPTSLYTAKMYEVLNYVTQCMSIFFQSFVKPLVISDLFEIVLKLKSLFYTGQDGHATSCSSYGRAF